MGTANPGEDRNSMPDSNNDKSISDKSPSSQFAFGADDRSEARRRLHLRDITNELPDASDDRAGADLRIARERRGEDMRAIAMSLRIRREQLEALEESRYDDLPGRAYAVGFVRSYAEYLGLDSAHIVDRYKAELDSRFATPSAGSIQFPEAREQMRLPRGTFLIIAVIIGVGAYGAYLMTNSADRLMAERVPAAPALAEAQITNPQAPDERRGLSGDPASAATRAENDATAAQLLGEGAPEVDPSSVYASLPVPEAVPAEAAPTQVAALTAPTATGDMSASSSTEVPAVTGLPEIPQGAAFGIENTDARVIVRARKPDAWVRIEDAQGHVLIERTMQVGDTYAVPNAPGSILVARDASAFELVVDHASLGLAGPPTLVLTGKPLDPSAILAAMPRTPPTAAEEAAALAPEATETR